MSWQEGARFLEDWQRSQGLVRQRPPPEEAEHYAYLSKLIRSFQRHLDGHWEDTPMPSAFAEPADAWRWAGPMIHTAVDSLCSEILEQQANPMSTERQLRDHLARSLLDPSQNAFWTHARVAQWAPVLLAKFQASTGEVIQPLSVARIDREPFVEEGFRFIHYISTCDKRLFEEVSNALGWGWVGTPFDVPEGVSLMRQDQKLHLAFDVSLFEKVIQIVQSSEPSPIRKACPAGDRALFEGEPLIPAFGKLALRVTRHAIWPATIAELNRQLGFSSGPDSAP
jgi:hypothetical protein